MSPILPCWPVPLPDGAAPTDPASEVWACHPLSPVTAQPSGLHHLGVLHFFRYLEMPYLIVRESYINSSCLVDGLPHNEIRLITEKSSSPSDLRDEKYRRVEFTTPAFNLLNCLEQIGYKVITSSSFVTGPKRFDTKDFIWTLYRSSCEIEA